MPRRTPGAAHEILLPSMTVVRARRSPDQLPSSGRVLVGMLSRRYTRRRERPHVAHHRGGAAEQGNRERRASAFTEPHLEIEQWPDSCGKNLCASVERESMAELGGPMAEEERGPERVEQFVALRRRY